MWLLDMDIGDRCSICDFLRCLLVVVIVGVVVECGFGGFYLVIESGTWMWFLYVVIECGNWEWFLYVVFGGGSWMWMLKVVFGGNYLMWLLVVVTW